LGALLVMPANAAAEVVLAAFPYPRSRSRASPKSRSFTSPSLERMTLPGWRWSARGKRAIWFRAAAKHRVS